MKLELNGVAVSFAYAFFLGYGFGTFCVDVVLTLLKALS